MAQRELTELPVVKIRMVDDGNIKLEGKTIRDSEDAIDFIVNDLRLNDREYAGVLNLNVKGEVINYNIVSIGGLTNTFLDPREVFKSSILSNAGSIIAFHNHPSGDVVPSSEDLMTTRRLIKAGKLIGIPVVDHIIAGTGRYDYYSMASDGIIRQMESETDNNIFASGREEEVKYNSERRSTFRDEMAARFIEVLEEHPMDWKKGWQCINGRPLNAVTERSYNGINTLWLNYVAKVRGYEDNRWATFNQIKDNNWKLTKGSKGCPIEYYMPIDNEAGKAISWQQYNKLSEEEKAATYIDERSGIKKAKYSIRNKQFTVFNADCIEGIEPRKSVDLPMQDKESAARETIFKIASGMNVDFKEDEKGDRSYYSPAQDAIFLPNFERFNSDYDYSAVALHELGHATGHESRLNRDQSGIFGSESYAKEELVAEITSCFMGEYVDVPAAEEHYNNHAAYVQSWADAIRDNKNYLFTAIKEAERAADYMIEKGELSLAKEESLALHKYEDNSRLRKEIDDVLNNRISMYESIKLCEHTPQILQDVGLEDKPILFTQRHLRDGLHPKGKNPKWHGLSVDDYLHLESNMKKPALIMDSFSDDDSVIVVTDTVDLDKNPIMACIKANGSGQYQLTTISSNYLTSVYGKDNFDNFLKNTMDADYLLFSDKEKIQNLERSSKLQLLDNFSKDFEFNEIIHKSENIVKEDNMKASHEDYSKSENRKGNQYTVAGGHADHEQNRKKTAEIEI